MAVLAAALGWVWTPAALAGEDETFTVNPANITLQLDMQGFRQRGSRVDSEIETDRIFTRKMINFLTDRPLDSFPPRQWILAALFPCGDPLFEAFLLGVWDTEDRELVLGFQGLLEFFIQAFAVQTRGERVLRNSTMSVAESFLTLIAVAGNSGYNRLPGRLREGNNDDRRCINGFRSNTVNGAIDVFFNDLRVEGTKGAFVPTIKSGSLRAGNPIDTIDLD